MVAEEMDVESGVKHEIDGKITDYAVAVPEP
jgi:hypothetical protein